MPYIGKGANGFGIRERYRYSASGSQTAFTGSDLDSKTLQIDNGSLVDVYLNGVLLDTADYNTSTANTVTLTSGATASDEVMIVVYDVFSLSDAMPKTGGTFSGGIIANSTLDMNGTELILDADADTSITADTDDQIDVKIAGSDAMHFLADGFKIRNADALIFGENNSTSRYQTIGGEVAANNLTYRTYQSHIFKNTTGQTSTTDGTEVLKIDANGHVTMPKQSAFSAYLSAAQNNIAANNSFVDVQFNTEVFDLNADYNTSNYTFTAPVTGKYQFNAAISLSNLDSSSDYAFVTLTTSNRAYYNYIGANQMDADDRMLLPISILADLDASDTAKIRLGIYTGTAQADISTGEVVSSFQGYLVC